MPDVYASIATSSYLQAFERLAVILVKFLVLISFVAFLFGIEQRVSTFLMRSAFLFPFAYRNAANQGAGLLSGEELLSQQVGLQAS